MIGLARGDCKVCPKIGLNLENGSVFVMSERWVNTFSIYLIKLMSLLPLSFFKKLLTIETNTQRMGDQYRFFCLNFCQGIF